MASLQISVKSWGSRPWLENFIAVCCKERLHGVRQPHLPTLQISSTFDTCHRDDIITSHA